jgi:hypothetical protein
MRRQIVKLSAVAAATAAIGLGADSAARADETVATAVKVPFTFIVNDVRLPAGDYSVREVSAGGQVLEIVSADGRHVAFTMTIPSGESQPNSPQLVFEKFGDAYFLSRIAPGDGNDREIVLTPALMERESIGNGEHAAN